MNTTKSVYTQQSDNELIEAYKKTRNNIIIAVLMERYAALVLGVCLKYVKNEALAKDIAMEVFENLFVDLKKHTITNFQAWLYIVTKNNCLIYLRREKKSNEQLLDYKRYLKLVMEKEVFLHPDEDTKERLLLKLDTCFNKLNREQQTTIDLFYLQDKSYNEVAGITGYNLKEVKSYIQNGKRNLLQCLTKNNE